MKKETILAVLTVFLTIVFVLLIIFSASTMEIKTIILTWFTLIVLSILLFIDLWGKGLKSRKTKDHKLPDYKYTPDPPPRPRKGPFEPAQLTDEELRLGCTEVCPHCAKKTHVKIIRQIFECDKGHEFIIYVTHKK